MVEATLTYHWRWSRCRVPPAKFLRYEATASRTVICSVGSRPSGDAGPVGGERALPRGSFVLSHEGRLSTELLATGANVKVLSDARPGAHGPSGVCGVSAY